MAALVGARHAVAFQGGLVIKGFSAMLIPVKTNGDSIQWHMISNSIENRMAYQAASARCPDRCSLREVSERILRSTRTFLGWWERAENYLGSDCINYDNLDWSSAKEARRPVRISGGALGFQNLMAGEVNFILGPKDGRLHLSQKGPFKARLRSAEKHPVVLYDNDDRRGWLVSAVEVILHIIFGRHHLRPYKVGNKPIHLEPTSPNSPNPTKLALLENRHIRLYDEEQYTYGDAVLDLWSSMEVLIDKTHALGSAPGLPVHNPFRNKLQGWEIMSLVEESPVLRRKQRHINRTNGGWVGMVKDLDAVILFGRGFDEIIRPVQTTKLCQQWRRLPKGNDYLAVGCQLLKQIMYQAGSRNDYKYLTSTRLRLSKRSELFSPCKHAGARTCDCLRLQRVKQPSLLQGRNRFSHIPDQGCVIFGEPRRLNLKPHTKQVKKTSVGNGPHPIAVEAESQTPRSTITQNSDGDVKDISVRRQRQKPFPLTTESRRALPGSTFKVEGNRKTKPHVEKDFNLRTIDSHRDEDDEDEIQDVPMVKLNVTPTPVLHRKGKFERHEASCICRACRLAKNSQFKVPESSSPGSSRPLPVSWESRYFMGAE